MGRLIFLSLLAIPLAEIAVFILVGGAIGLWPTLGLVLVTAIVGTMLLRSQGFAVVGRIRAEVADGMVPAEALGHGVLILIAGALLLTPGFVTDTLGLLLFVPGIRRLIWRAVGRRLTIAVADPHRNGPRTVDLDAADYYGPGDGDSPWRGP
jgi:UPF0716 protein FxsA